jgi:hypothetical protein
LGAFGKIRNAAWNWVQENYSYGKEDPGFGWDGDFGIAWGGEFQAFPFVGVKSGLQLEMTTEGINSIITNQNGNWFAIVPTAVAPRHTLGNAVISGFSGGGAVRFDLDQSAVAIREVLNCRQRYEPGAVKSVKLDVSLGYLNLRGGPGQDQTVIDRIPAGATGIVVIGSCVPSADGRSRYPFCPVEWNGQRGWVSSSGLE